VLSEFPVGEEYDDDDDAGPAAIRFESLQVAGAD
jgi:hypothetical protein